MSDKKISTRANAFQLDIAASIVEQLQPLAVAADQLVTERDLAEELGISRSPVRAALGVLVDRGIMALEPGTGLAGRPNAEAEDREAHPRRRRPSWRERGWRSRIA